MMINGHNHSDFSEEMQKFHDYIQALEEERRKIQVFQRELPLCLELVIQAIETCKQQLSRTTTKFNFHGQSECSEQISSDLVPVLEEFIPLKWASSYPDGGERESKKIKNGTGAGYDKNSKKSDWLKSVQLWNQTPDPPTKEEFGVVEVKKNGSGGAFHHLKKEKNIGGGGGSASTSSTADTSGSCGGNNKEEKDGHSQRKARRCWSPELHTRFLQALQQLGGAQAATPKQIRALMKVDDLTNDEVKSHLQKYRLHIRRPSPSILNNNNTQTPQFVVVGGIWVPPEYAAMATTTTAETSGVAASKEIYCPVAALPPPPPSPKQKKHKPSSHSSDNRGTDSEGGDVQSYTSATSSKHTTTVSPV